LGPGKKLSFPIVNKYSDLYILLGHNATDNLLKKPIKNLLKTKTVQQTPKLQKPKNAPAFSVRVNPIVSRFMGLSAFLLRQY